MGSAVDQLLALQHEKDPYGTRPTDLLPLQLEAANERLCQSRRRDPAAAKPGGVGWRHEGERARRPRSAAVRTQRVQELLRIVAHRRSVGPHGQVAAHRLDPVAGRVRPGRGRRPRRLRDAARNRRVLRHVLERNHRQAGHDPCSATDLDIASQTNVRGLSWATGINPTATGSSSVSARGWPSSATSGHGLAMIDAFSSRENSYQLPLDTDHTSARSWT